LARNAKDALCWSALVQARIELANANQIQSDSIRSKRRKQKFPLCFLRYFLF
jgi:hypothetical protein